MKRILIATAAFLLAAAAASAADRAYYRVETAPSGSMISRRNGTFWATATAIRSV